MKYIIYAVIAAFSGLALGLGVVQVEFAGGGDYFRLANTHLPPIDENGKSLDTVEVTDTSAPRAKVIGDSVIELGSIEQFTTGKKIFKIGNEGNAPLQLVLAGTTCKCTVGKLETDTVAPGEVAEIELTYKAEQMTLHYSHGATIRTNDPENSKIELTVTGVVERRIFTIPEQVVFTRISANSPSTQELGLYTIRLPDLELKEITFDDKSTAEFFEAEIVEMTPEQLKAERSADAGKQIVIRTKPGIPNGPFRQTMRIRTNQSNDLVVPVSGTVIADVTIVGGSRYNIDTGVFNLGVAESKTGASATLYVLVKGPNRDEIQVDIDSVTPNDVLQAELGEPVTRGKVKRYELKLVVPPNSPTVNYLGSIDKGYGSVILTTTDPRNKRIRVRVYFAVE